MTIPFIKMHAQGNDFVILQDFSGKLQPADLPRLAIDICDRHFGLGADGLVLLETDNPSMEIYNADGSRPEMCGSALRCCCYLLSQLKGSNQVSIQTDNGLAEGNVDELNPLQVTVDIGKPEMVEQNVELDGFKGDYIKVGNPHYVVYTDSLDDNPHLQYGKKLSEHPYFPDGANVEFVRLISRHEIELKVWERGVGATLACGTGSTAAVFSGIKAGWLDTKVRVALPGGSIFVLADKEVYRIDGNVTFVAKGEYEWKI
jgi:diaminopimelate epimerase